MGWNYRVIRRKISFVHGEIPMHEYTYHIHQAYVDENDKVGSITFEPIHVFGTTIEELQKVYELISDAFTKPILDIDNIPEKGYKSKKFKRTKSGKTFPYTAPVFAKGTIQDILKQMELERTKTEAAYEKKLKRKKKTK